MSVMDIPFESFAKLIYRLGHPPKSSKTSKPIPPEKIFASWLNHLPRPLPPHSGKHLFRLLFPHEGSRRRYGLKETKLAAELERVLGLDGLTRWDSVSWDRAGEGGTGCFGKEIEIAMRARGSNSQQSTLTLRKLDMLLDELASASPFSQLSQQPPSARPLSTLLSLLYRESNLSSYALAVLTQIILRDLRPLLDPLPRLPIRNPTAMLRLKSTAGPEQLTLRQAICRWDQNMWRLYWRGMGDLDKCADLAEAMAFGHHASIPEGPVVGVNVKIPKCRKGRSVPDALKAFMDQPSCEAVWAETKYDGYRMQIHVEIPNNGQPRITVFSKSMRDSTQDRLNAHSIILAALGLPGNPKLPAHPALSHRIVSLMRLNPSVKRSVILEAEVVPYSESSREGSRGPGIEEFWHLGSAGVSVEPAMDFLNAGSSRRKDRHLCLVFFDILHLDGEGLLELPYDERRKQLENVVMPIDGFARLAERTLIPIKEGKHAALEVLNLAFKNSNAKREEGLVLKAADSLYNDWRSPWVKLKKDYIPNLGDCIDLVLLGAGWDVDRARELRVDTSVFTTFYIGTLTNAEGVRSHRELPHFEILFRASYGPSREELEVWNSNLRHGRWGSKPYDRDDPLKRRLIGLSWNYTIPKTMSPPSVLLQQPLCVEVMGAGFQKLPGSRLYELRWPRLQKVFDPIERPWTDALRGPDLIITAHQSLGYNTSTPLSPRSPHSLDDSINAAWHRSSSGILVDIPELISPESKRSRSAPAFSCGLFEGAMKESPKSPSPARGRPRAALVPAKRVRPHLSEPEAGKRLKAIIDAHEGVTGLASVTASHQGGKRGIHSDVDVVPDYHIRHSSKQRRGEQGAHRIEIEDEDRDFEKGTMRRALSLRSRLKLASRYVPWTASVRVES